MAICGTVRVVLNDNRVLQYKGSVRDDFDASLREAQQEISEADANSLRNFIFDDRKLDPDEQLSAFLLSACSLLGERVKSITYESSVTDNPVAFQCRMHPSTCRTTREELLKDVKKTERNSSLSVIERMLMGRIPQQKTINRLFGQESDAVPPANPTTQIFSLDSSQATTAVDTVNVYLQAVARRTGRPTYTMIPKRVFSDELGYTHVRCDRTVPVVCDGETKNLPIVGQQTIYHIDPEGKVSSTTGRDLVPSVLSIMSLSPQGVAISLSTAIEQAKQAFANQYQTSDAITVREDKARLCLYEHNGHFITAYELTVVDFGATKDGKSSPAVVKYYVDASNATRAGVVGQIAGITSSLLPKGRPLTRGPRDDATHYYGQVDLSTTRDPATGKYILEDKNRRVVTQNAKGMDANDVAGEWEKTSPFTDDDNKWGAANDPNREIVLSAADVHFGVCNVSDFMDDMFHRKSIDGEGMEIRSMVNIGLKYNNAFMYEAILHFGEGDGVEFAPLTPGDVVCHEEFHAVEDFEAAHIYDKNESGGLNEANSDIFGSIFDWWISKTRGLNLDHWKIGEQCTTPGTEGDALRYMSDPLKDGYSIDHYSLYRDGTDMHLSSGIANNFFYLLVEGGTNRTSGMEVEGLKSALGGIDAGMDAGAKIWYRALTTYMRPNDTFKSARNATLRAAKDLYGSSPNVQAMVTSAWAAVGVDA